MVTTASQTALQQKMAAGRDGAHSSGRSALRALRLAMARAAADLFDMPLSVIGATQSRCPQDTLGTRFKDDHLLILLDGPDRRIGAASVDRVTLAAMIQQQTTGRVVGGDPDERPFTATDAAMMAPLIDTALKRACETADADLDKQCLDGFRFGARAEDRHNLMLALDADRYRVFDLTFEFEGGNQQGGLCLVLPEHVPAQSPEGETPAPSGPCLEQALSSARADLTAVIGRMRISLSALGRLEVGSVLPLNQQELSDAELIGIDGRKVATASLGQSGGMRAVRLAQKTSMAIRPEQTAEFETLANATLAQQNAHDIAGHPGEIDGADLPAALAEIDAPNKASVNATDQESDNSMLGMSTQDVAVEISQLAGLSLEDEGTVP